MSTERGVYIKQRPSFSFEANARRPLHAKPIDALSFGKPSLREARSTINWQPGPLGILKG